MVQIEPPLFVFIDDLSVQRVLTNKAGRSPVGNPDAVGRTKDVTTSQYSVSLQMNEA